MEKEESITYRTYKIIKDEYGKAHKTILYNNGYLHIYEYEDYIEIGNHRENKWVRFEKKPFKKIRKNNE